LLNPFVSRVNRRDAIRVERLKRSTYEVEISFSSGLPLITAFSIPVTVVQALASLADRESEMTYRVAVKVKEPCGRTDRHAFRQRTDDLSLFVEWENVHCQPRALICRVRGATMIFASFGASAFPDALK
jgi:hypothetical protein